MTRWIAVLAWMVLSSASALAQSADPPVQADKRVLAGHPFLPNGLAFEPFDTRHYDMSVGVGYASSEFDPPFNAPIDFNYATFAFEGFTQQPLVDYLTLRFGVLGFLITGVDEDTALNFGLSGSYDFNVGLMSNLFANDRFSISVGLDVTAGESYRLDPLTAIEDSIEAQAVTASTLFIEQTNIGLNPSLGVAVGVVSWLGLVASLEYSHGWAFSDQQNEQDDSLEIAIGISTNFEPVGAPIGFGATYQRSENFTDSLQSSHDAQFSFMYTPSKHFAVGVLATGAFISGELAEDGTNVSEQVWQGQLGMRYYQ